MDFSSEVQLVRKLGEGGFGQVRNKRYFISVNVVVNVSNIAFCDMR